MNSTTDQINEIKEQIKILDKQNNELWDAKYKLSQKQHSLSVQFVAEENLLQKTKWNLRSYSDAYYLYAIDEIDQKMEELLRSDYHCGIDLEDGVELRFDDSDCSLHFDSKQILSEFIKKNKLTVVTDDVDDQITELQNKLDLLKEIKDATK